MISILIVAFVRGEGMTHPLGQWAVIDIETSGIDPNYDQIIDVGFLQFEGTKLVRTYSSLVRYTENLSFFIQKLTGITQSMAQKAPIWDTVEPEVQDLYGHHLLAHNSDFERSFLSEYYEKIETGDRRESYEDSLFFLALLFPERSSLKLENFIIEWGLAEKEEHRGLQDSVDLLKVLLVGCSLVKKDPEKYQTLLALFRKYGLENYWYYKFLSLDHMEYQEIAEQIDFDLDDAISLAQNKIVEANVHDPEVYPEPNFDFEFSGENIKNILQNEEKMGELFPGYRYRDSQVELALRTGQAFKNKVHALVQAPTGTGKTLGYLLPAALFAMNERQPILVATGTKTLQHQAMAKDVPQLRKLLGVGESELKIRRLVGSNNHLCELLFREAVDQEDLLFSSKSFEEKVGDMYLDMVFFHNSRATNNEQILRGDLPYVLKRKIETFRERENEIGVDYRSCTGNRCPFKAECSYLQGLREAKDADIVIGNHALMFTWPRAFPRPAYIVVDEAHKIEDETTKAFSVEASKESLEHFARAMANLQGVGSLFYLMSQHEDKEGDATPVINEIREETLRSHQMLMDHLGPLMDLTEHYFKKRPRYTDKFWNEALMVRKEGQDPQGVGIYNSLDSIKFILENYSTYLLPFTSRFEVKNMEDDNQLVALTRLETFTGQLDDLVQALDYALSMKAGYSHTLRFHEREGYSVSSSPVDVGQILHDQLLQTSASVIYTSATLGNAKGDQGGRGIEWSTGYTYLEPERRFRKGFYLPASYDYKNNTKVFLCDDMPPFFDRTFVEKTLKEVMKLIRELGGRSLLLFSARTRFEVAREILLKEFDGEIPLFIQGMGNNVVDEFKKEDSAILIGMESFGEGIDIPGERLQFVFIDKIPDLRMEQVINDRRDFYEGHFGNEFTDYYLAHRTRSLHQKLGRLLRTEKDIGGVIIVDSRIRKWKGKTMEKLFKLMEPYKIERADLHTACSEVQHFIEEKSDR